MVALWIVCESVGFLHFETEQFYGFGLKAAEKSFSYYYYISCKLYVRVRIPFSVFKSG